MIEQAPLFNQINFQVQPFDPDAAGDPVVATVQGANETAAQTVVSVFLCPSDFNRMPSRA